MAVTAIGKFFPNGLDLERLSAHADRRAEYIASMEELCARPLELPVITVAASRA